MLHRFFCRPFFLKKAPKSVLILRFSSIGDVLLTTPAVEALARHWPNTRIFFAAKRMAASLLAHNPHITEVLALDPGESLFRFAWRLARLQPDVVLDLHNKARSKFLRLFFLCKGVPSVVWKNRTLRDYFPLPLQWKNFHSRVLFSDRHHHAVERLTGQSLPRGFLRYYISPKEKKEAFRILEDFRLDMSLPILGMAPSARWETKRWPLEYFIELAARAQKNKVQILLFGSKEDKALINKMQKKLGNTPSLCGASLRTAGACISYCRMFVSNDSGPMHIARALGVPTATVFGSTDPKMFDFRGHAAVYRSEPCSPCGFNGRSSCPRGHFRCMRELHPEKVWDILKALLERQNQEGKNKVPYLHA